jgi:hypothetical protein
MTSLLVVINDANVERIAQLMIVLAQGRTRRVSGIMSVGRRWAHYLLERSAFLRSTICNNTDDWEGDQYKYHEEQGEGKSLISTCEDWPVRHSIHFSF